MKDLVKALENLPWIVRVLLVLLWGAYGNLIRLFKSIAANNIVAIVLSVILLLCGGFVILWIVDLVCVLTNKNIWWIC